MRAIEVVGDGKTPMECVEHSGGEVDMLVIESKKPGWRSWRSCSAVGGHSHKSPDRAGSPKRQPVDTCV